MKSGLLITVLLLLAACDTSHGGSRDDAPVGKIHTAARPVWLAPDKFPSVVAWCIGPNGVYTHTRNPADAVDVIKDDPNCAEGGVLYETRDDV